MLILTALILQEKAQGKIGWTSSDEIWRTWT